MKEIFKKTVLEWLATNNYVPKKVRVYRTRRYGLEVRVYGEPQTFTNQRKSFRERKEERDEKRHGSYGVHSRTYSNYVAINENTFKTKEEEQFTLECLKSL